VVRIAGETGLEASAVSGNFDRSCSGHMLCRSHALLKPSRRTCHFHSGAKLGFRHNEDKTIFFVYVYVVNDNIAMNPFSVETSHN